MSFMRDCVECLQDVRKIKSPASYRDSALEVGVMVHLV